MDSSTPGAWKALGGVGLIESEQDIKGKVSVERRYFIVSTGIKTVEQFADAAPAHWGVEAMHGVLDVTFRENDCRVSKGHAAQNLSAIRKFALAALRTDTQHPTISLAAAVAAIDAR